MKRDDFLKIEIEGAVDRIETILDSGVFKINYKKLSSPRMALKESKKLKNSLRCSGMIEILINLRDLMWKCENIEGQRVKFDENIVKAKYKFSLGKKNKKIKIEDITDVIEYMRNAVCHINSFEMRMLNQRLFISSGFMYDRSGDFKFVMGEQELWMEKGIIRALNEIKIILSKYLVEYNERKRMKNYCSITEKQIRKMLKKYNK